MRGSLSSSKSTVGSVDDVAMLRERLKKFFATPVEHLGGTLGSSRCGIYAFFDFDGEPIYVGQTVEGVAVRVRRHLTNQRTDAVAMRVLDPLEVAEVRVWPLGNLASSMEPAEVRELVDRYEFTAYRQAIEESAFGAILNEKVPPFTDELLEMPDSYSCLLYDADTLAHYSHPDLRIQRRAEALSRLTDVVRERGEVSLGLRRVVVLQALRLAFLSSERYLAIRNNKDAADIDITSAAEQLVAVLLEE